VEGPDVKGLEDNVVFLVKGISVNRSEGNEDSLVVVSLVKGISVDRSEGNKDSLVAERLSVDDLKDMEISLVE